jgi:hypothetical protein
MPRLKVFDAARWNMVVVGMRWSGGDVSGLDSGFGRKSDVFWCTLRVGNHVVVGALSRHGAYFCRRIQVPYSQHIRYCAFVVLVYVQTFFCTHAHIYFITPTSSGFIPAVQQQLRTLFLEPFRDFRYNSNELSNHMPLSTPLSQALLISAYLLSVWFIRKHYRGILRDSAGFLKLAVAHNIILAFVSLLLLLMLADQVQPSMRPQHSPPAFVYIVSSSPCSLCSPPSVALSPPPGVASPSGRRAAFRGVRRELLGYR